jgi:hypothetical protein
MVPLVASSSRDERGYPENRPELTSGNFSRRAERTSSWAAFLSLEKFIDEKIQEAMAKGEFDDLPGKGKPIDLSDYFATPEDRRIAYSVLKNASVLPEEGELLKEIETLKRRLADCRDQQMAARLRKTLNESVLKLNLALERHKKRLG